MVTGMLWTNTPKDDAHRSQGSTVPTVFVDGPNIMKNRNDREAMRCLYVATSRASEMLYTRKT